MNGQFDGPATEFVAGSVYAYRRWRWTLKSGPADPPDVVLSSVFFSPRFWDAGVNLARCQTARHCRPVADPHCSCGYYAYWRRPYRIHGRCQTVAGVVEAFGQVVEGDRGLRAEKARIVGLVVRPGSILAERLAKSYPDARRFRSIRQMRRAFPPARRMRLSLDVLVAALFLPSWLAWTIATLLTIWVHGPLIDVLTLVSETTFVSVVVAGSCRLVLGPVWAQRPWRGGRRERLRR